MSAIHYRDSDGINQTPVSTALPLPVLFPNNALITGPLADGAGNGISQYAFAAYGRVFNGTTWDRVVKPNATSRIVSAAASTNATSAKTAAGNVYAINGYNAAAAVKYLKLYNKATAPTVGTDTPVMTLALEPTRSFQFYFASGYYFSTGIAYALTGAAADADATALTAADVVGLNISYA